MEYKLPEIKINEDIQENLENIEKVIDDLNKRRDAGLSEEFQKRLNKQVLVSHVYHSNAIEGNKLTLRETEIILDGMLVNERPLKDELEARSLANAIEYLHNIISGQEQLNQRTLLELHGLILETTDPDHGGKFRKTEVTIKNSEHTPPSFLHVESELNQLFMWMNRNAHKYNPIVMGALLHHWLTWIHPFKDGNGRVSRLFLNFFLIQKGYPEIVIRIEDRDIYYDSLISADTGTIEPLIEFIAKNIRLSVDKIEEFINEEERQQEWKDEWKEYSVGQSSLYEKSKEFYQYQYEVWKKQMEVFKLHFIDSIKDLQESLTFLEFSLDEYDTISLAQYLDLLEDKKVTNTWFMRMRVFDLRNKEAISFVFFAKRFAQQKPFRLLGTKVIDKDTGKVKLKDYYPEVKLYLSERRGGASRSNFLNRTIDLFTIGCYKDELVFGIRNRTIGKEHHILTQSGGARKVIRKFIDQILKEYINVDQSVKVT